MSGTVSIFQRFLGRFALVSIFQRFLGRFALVPDVKFFANSCTDVFLMQIRSGKKELTYFAGGYLYD